MFPWLPKNMEDEILSSHVYKTLKNTKEYFVEQYKVNRNSKGSYNSPFSEKNSANPQGSGSAVPPSSWNRTQPVHPQNGGQNPDASGPSYHWQAPQQNPYVKTAPVYHVPYQKTKTKKKRTPAEIPEGMQALRVKSPAPFYTVGLIWLLYALFLPLYAWWHFLIAAVISAVFGLLASKVFRGTVKLVPKPEPAPAAPQTTGNPEIDKMLADGNAYLKKLHAADDAIENESISKNIVHMEITIQKIFDFIVENPKKLYQIRRFMNYYLPTTLKLLESYERLSKQGIQGENISTTMFHIEGMMHTIEIAFEKQLDALFQDEALDISADITVMENMLAQEGLTRDTK